MKKFVPLPKKTLILARDLFEQEEVLAGMQLPINSERRAFELARPDFSQDLFGSKPVMWLRLDAPTKSEEEKIEHIIKNFDGYLLVFSSTTKWSIRSHFDLVIDLLSEKPWDREKRVKQWIIERVKREDKSISDSLAEFLGSSLSWDMSLIKNELEKFFLYDPENKEVTKVCFEAFSLPLMPLSSWQLAESIAFCEERLLTPPLDIGGFIELVGQIRFQLHQGLKLASLAHLSSQELEAHFPKMKPSILAEKLSKAKRLGVAYFDKGLKSLYEIEFGLKSSMGTASTLFDLLRGKLHDALPTS